MDTTTDNPLKRFTTVLWGLGLIVLFAVLALLVAPWVNQSEESDPIYKEQQRTRLQIKEEMEKAQAAALKVDPEAVFESVGKELLAGKPTPVKDNAQVVPGSPTQLALAESSGDPLPETTENPDDMPIDPAVMELGKAQYAVCSACHGADGNGIPNLAPPLAGSEWVLGPVENLIRIQLRGLTGPITVKGVDYNLVAPMAPMAYQNDEQIAAVLTFVRNSFGNKASPVTPDQVAPLRSEAGKPMLTVEDLIAPAPAN